MDSVLGTAEMFMHNNRRWWLPLLGIAMIGATTTLGVAQNDANKPTPSVDVPDEIPAEALKTEEGRQLVERLRYLRRSEKSMGSKHPAYEGIQAEIRSILGKLGLDPSVTAADNATLNVSTDSLSEDELRLLIRRMALRIESLEKRVESLERRLEVF